MGKDLSRHDSSFPAQSFHFSPDIASVPGFSASCHKDLSFFDIPFANIPFQKLLKLLGQKNLTAFSLAGHGCEASVYSFHRNKRKLADADSRGADSLKRRLQPLLFLSSGSFHQPSVFIPGQFLILGAEDLLLHAYLPNTAVCPAAEPQKAVYGREHGIDALYSINFF